MSQKTNPLSLRLQKNNQNFSSPWFADFFFTESYHHNFMINKYITSLLKEVRLSKAFFSAKNAYRKSNVFLVMQDTRAYQKEKQLSFNLKGSSSSYKAVALPFFRKTTPNRKNKAILPNVQERINKSYVTDFAKLFFIEKEEKTILFSLFLRKQMRNDFLKSKQHFNLIDHFWCLSFFENPNIVESDSQNQIKSGWGRNNKNLIRKNSCFSFCEKIVQQEMKSSIDFFQKDNSILRFELPFLSKTNLNVNRIFPITTSFQPIRFIGDTQSVVSLLDGVVALLEKRVTFRQIKSKLFRDLSKSSLIKGVRISCSGRLGGRSKKAQKAKLQSDQWGETSLNAFSSNIVFARKSAYTSYGKVGIKIWLSFENKAFEGTAKLDSPYSEANHRR